MRSSVAAIGGEGRDGQTCCYSEAVSAAGCRSRAEELMQYRRPPASRGPSSNTWPRWPPQRLQTTSERIIPCEKSPLTSTASAPAGSVKLGQPDPESNFVSDENSSALQPAQR